MIYNEMYRQFRTFNIILLCCGLLFACAHSPKYSESTSTTNNGSTENTSESTNKKTNKGQKIADLAHALLGSPYKYGGASPKGFDCSGLVLYTHGKVGVATPRTSYQQHKTAKNIKLNEVTPGDLIFFKLHKSRVSHVGIYVGKGRFIHAPKSGKRVAVNQLKDGFWKPRIVSAGRLH